MVNILKNRILIGVLLAIGLGLLLVPSTIYANLFVGLIEKNIDRSKIFVSLDEPELTFIGLSFEQVTIRPRQAPLLIALKDVRVRLGLRKILSEGLQILIDGTWLDGSVQIELSPMKRKAKIQLAEVHLTQLPLLEGFGFEQALLRGSATVQERAELTPPLALDIIQISLDKVTKREPTTLDPRITGAPIPITIPALSDTSLELQGKINGEEIHLPVVRLLSSLGNLEGTISIKEPNAFEPEVLVRLDGILSEAGFEIFGGPLELFSKRQISSHSQPFTFELTNPLRPVPKIQISPR
jgi:hypothetical protein